MRKKIRKFQVEQHINPWFPRFLLRRAEIEVERGEEEEEGVDDG